MKLHELAPEIENYMQALEVTNSQLDRLITTGLLPRHIAFDQGASGPIKRASVPRIRRLSCMPCDCCCGAQSSMCIEVIMANELFVAMPVLWAIALLAALIERSGRLARVALALGCIVGIAVCIAALPEGLAEAAAGYQLGGNSVHFALAAPACWLVLFGLIPAFFVTLGSTATARPKQSAWLAGAALSLLGAFGVFGLQDAMSFLIAWEVMSLGGAVMILGEELSPAKGGSHFSCSRSWRSAPSLFCFASCCWAIMRDLPPSHASSGLP